MIPYPSVSAEEKMQITSSLYEAQFEHFQFLTV